MEDVRCPKISMTICLVVAEEEEEEEEEEEDLE
jgi:hypothetical protein